MHIIIHYNAVYNVVILLFVHIFVFYFMCILELLYMQFSYLMLLVIFNYLLNKCM
jgi:hypothetical protein